MKRSILNITLSTVLVASLANASGLVLAGNSVEFSKKLSLNKIVSLDTDRGLISIIIKTKKPLLQKQKDLLYKDGAKAIKYAGENSFYLLCSNQDFEKILQDITDLEGVAFLDTKYKISKDLKNISLNEKIRVKIEFLNKISLDEFKKELNKKGIEAYDIKSFDDFDMVEVTIFGIDLEELASLPNIKYITKYHKISLIKPFSKELKSADIYTAKKTNATKVWSDLGLDGSNIKVAVVDEGKAKKDHIEFKEGKVSRVKNRVGSGSLSLHTTHVIGIIGANGVNSEAKGMANETIIYNYSYQDTFFAQALKTMYNKDRILVSNHSYGYTDKSELGVYSSDASNEDSVIYANPYIAMFIAAGNDRGRDGYRATGIIKGGANAKNVFTIGALDAYSNDVAYYSSVGPTNDGRIKPELSVCGTSIYSTSSDGGYTYMSGTSMATPAALGLATLVMQEYKNLTKCGNGGCDMRSDLLKAILINTAVDKNKKGPDIYTGYGMIDAKAAVDVVKTLKDSMQKIKLDRVSRGESKEYRFSKNTDGKFKVTISWVDRAGNSAGGKALVNDIDCYVENINSGKKYYPYVLNGLNIVKGINHVDNNEQIEIDNLPAGEYRLVVNGDNLQSSKSDFAIACSEAIFSKSSSGIELKEEFKMDSFAKVIFDSLY